MTLIGDSKAYVVLSKHGPLVKQLPNRSFNLTFEGRVFIITFLLFYEYLKKEHFNEIAMQLNQQPASAAFETGKMMRTVCQRWMDENTEIKYDVIVPHTDLNYGEMRFMFTLLVAGQKVWESAVEGPAQ